MNATIEVKFSDLSAETAVAVSDRLQRGLDANSRAIGPMTEVNTAAGTVSVSFEFEAAGDALIDVPQAMEIIADTIGLTAPGSDVEGIPIEWGSLSHRVQTDYALA